MATRPQAPIEIICEVDRLVYGFAGEDDHEEWALEGAQSYLWAWPAEPSDLATAGGR
ncbi:hypothetical protein [Isoptericola croceus]|uniref:hypothetical protein n=1 Tax=Isoptericola croceus TaxID=3031406 RepID=UPI0023F89CB0|nr:hypothetical protein [Isoptericola croceus]